MKLRFFCIFLALLVLLPLAGQSAEKVKIRSGKAALTFQTTDVPLTTFEAFNAFNGFEARVNAVVEDHLGYPDLKHGQMNEFYGIPVENTYPRFFRTQTIHFGGNVSFHSVPYPSRIPSGYAANLGLDLVMRKDDFNVDVISGASLIDYVSNTFYDNGAVRTSEHIHHAGLALPYLINDFFGQQMPVVVGEWTIDNIPVATARGIVPATPFYGMQYQIPGERFSWLYFWGADWFSGLSGVAGGRGFGISPASWSPDSAHWDSFTMSFGPEYAVTASNLSYTLDLSEEDTIADVQTRFAAGLAAANLADIPWGTYRHVAYGGRQVDNWSTSNISVYLFNQTSTLPAAGYGYSQRAEVRFSVPVGLQVPGASYRGRVVETFTPDAAPDATEVVKIHEVEMHAGQWVSPVIIPVMHAGDGVTRLQPMTLAAELVDPHRVAALGGLAFGPTPWEYATLKPTITEQSLLTDANGNGFLTRNILVGSNTLQQINLADTRGTLGRFPGATVTWSVLPGATAAVRLWRWTDDGSALGVWALVGPGDNLAPYFGSGTDFIFAEALGEGKATIRITTSLGTAQVSDDLVIQSYLAAELTVDANRDGQIKLSSEDASDATSTANPYRFWLNDDDDRNGLDHPGSSTKDYTNTEIDSKRDLEDFARLHIYLQGLSGAISSGQVKVGVRWKEVTGDPGIRIYKAVESDGGTKYLSDDVAAGQQIGGMFRSCITGENGRQRVAADGFVFQPDFWSRLTDAHTTQFLLFEGVSEGKGRLIIELYKADGVTKLGEGPGVWIDIKNIKKMYQGPGTTFQQPLDERPQAIVFVHGWNMSPEGSLNFAETMFKRLWHRGFKGRFATLRWDTHYSDAFDNLPVIGSVVEGYLADYNSSERIAWQSGLALKAVVDALPAGYSRNLVAHSMGNIVAGSALLAGLTVNNYVLLQAAVPASCYDDRDLLKQPQSQRPYVGVDVTLWENDTPDDDPVAETRALAYRGRLSGDRGNLVSFYLPNDAATTYAWEFNNDQFKPATTYGYTRGAGVVMGTQMGLWKRIGSIEVGLNDPFETMPLACRSWSKLVGAESRTAGAIQGNLDLSSETFSLPGATLGFREEHSAQFNRSIQVLQPFYQELLRALKIPQNP